MVTRARVFALIRANRSIDPSRAAALPLQQNEAQMQKQFHRGWLGDKGGVSFGTLSPRGGLRPHRRPTLLRSARKGARSSRIGCVPRACCTEDLWGREPSGNDTTATVEVA